MTQLKTQDNCSPEDPEQHLLWALTTVPGMGESPMTIPVPLAKVISKHLVECGFRHDPTVQTKKLRRPYRGQQTSYNNAAKWVPMDDPEPDPVVIQDPRTLTVEEREAQLQIYREMGEIPDPVPPPNVAHVVGEE